MTKVIQKFMMTTGLVLAFCTLVTAQTPVQADKVPVKLQIVISRFEGGRKVSSLPYTMLATANGPEATLNVGIRMPVGTQLSYTDVGTNFRCLVTTEAGQFKVALTLNDNSVIDAKPSATTPASPNAPSFRNFNYNGTVTLKDGESKEFATAADKVTNEVVKIEVTLTRDK